MKALFALVACSFLFAAGAQAAEHAAPAGKAAGAHEATGEFRDNNALFPQPKMDAAKSTPPNPVKLVDPTMHQKMSGTSVTLKWEASETADAYHVQVATDPNFKWLKADDHWVKGTTFEAKDLEKGKSYYWRVAPWKNGNMAGTNKGAFAPSSFDVE